MVTSRPGGRIKIIYTENWDQVNPMMNVARTDAYATILLLFVEIMM